MIRQYLEIGEIVPTHGLAGELKLYPWADSPESIRRVKTVFLDAEGTRPVKVTGARPHKNMLLLTLEGTESVEAARKYIGRTLWADRKEIRLPKGQHFIADLLGLEVRDVRDGSHIGTVKDVTNTGTQDLYHVQLDSGEVRLVPGVDAFIKEIEIEKGYVSIEPIKGLLSDED